MSQNQDKEIVSRFMSDDNFRKQVLKDPVKALHGAGLKASPELLDKLKNADPDAVQKAVDAQKSGVKNATC
jgi:hypothetical protein